MPLKVDLSRSAADVVQQLAFRDKAKSRKLRKTLALLEKDPRHPGLNSHRYTDYDSLFDQKIWESYVENRTPGAYRVFWHYGPDPGEITVVAITPHP